MFCSIGLPSAMVPQLERWMAAQDVFAQVISVKVGRLEERIAVQQVTDKLFSLMVTQV